MSGHQPGAELDDAFKLAFFRALTDGIDGFVSCIDRQRRILFLNRTLTRDISDIVKSRIEDFIVPQHNAASIECVERAFASGEPQQIEFSVLLAQGTRLHLMTRILPFRGPRDEEVALLITSDVSEPRRL
ncbi:MAG: PAS domain-containing protein, partial [Deltaproteobacteria bacterium]